MSLFFNAGIDMNGICFRCLTKDHGEFCKKCMKLFAQKPNSKLLALDNTVESDPLFRKLWEAGKND